MTLNLTEILALPLIGEGSFRRVYCDGTTVYKIEYDEGITLGANMTEWHNARLITGLPNNVRVPQTDLYFTDGVPVITMPFIDGQPMGDCTCWGEREPDHDTTCLSDEFQSFMPDFDFSYGNVILSGDTYWLVDLDCDL